jgi:hypothetical protein
VVFLSHILAVAGGAATKASPPASPPASSADQLRKAWDLLEVKCKAPGMQSAMSCCLGNELCTWVVDESAGTTDNTCAKPPALFSANASDEANAHVEM